MNIIKFWQDDTNVDMVFIIILILAFLTLGIMGIISIFISNPEALSYESQPSQFYYELPDGNFLVIEGEDIEIRVRG